jgi:uncharacterized protein DUF4389
MTTGNTGYPVQLEVDYPPRLSRLLIFVKWLLWIPLGVEAFVLGIVLYIVMILGFVAVLVTGRFPESLWGFVTGFERWRIRVSSYLLLQTDRYPPFGLSDDPGYPVRLHVEYPDRIPRWAPLLHWLLVIPYLVVAAVIALVAFLGAIVAWFAILITGRYPEALFNLVSVALRWTARGTLYSFWAVRSYPPFTAD